MEVSRLTFTKETKAKMSKPLNPRERGVLRWQKLKELDSSGLLSKAKNRADISKMLGLGDGYGLGYNWVSSQINKGYLQENIYGADSNGKMEFEYHIVGEPDYHNMAAIRAKGLVPTKDYSTHDKVEVVAPPEPTVVVPVSEDKVKIVIKYNELVIEIGEVSCDMVERIVAKLADK